MEPTPLDYAAARPRRRAPWLAIVLGLIILVLLGLVWTLVQSERATRQALAASRAAQAQALSQMAAQAVATELQAKQSGAGAAAQTRDFTLNQRESIWLAEQRVEVSIDDITGGQVQVTIRNEAKSSLAGPVSMAEGDAITFSGPDGAALRLELLRLANTLVGDDSARFRITGAPQSPGVDPPAPVLTEQQKIELLLARILAADGARFIRNGSEHSPEEAVAHLRMKWEQAGGSERSGATAEDFIEQVGSRSSLSGREYRIRLSDGREVPSAQWLRERLREIEAPPASTTRPTTRPTTGPTTQTAMPPAQAADSAVQPDGGPGLSDQESQGSAPMNIPLPTLGGKQLWTDLRIDTDGWRIQSHALTGHCRLLDDRDRRRAWGSRSLCQDAWARLHPDPASPQRAGRELVVVLHGLGRTRAAMRPMADSLRDGGYDVVEFGYASTRATVDQHARALISVLEHLSGYDRVHFVGHSLGSLVVRRYLALAEGEAPGLDPPGRVVMLAPPNQGSRLAVRLQRNPVYLLALGPTGQEIADWKDLEATLATPKDFGVIAGSYGGLPNPLLDSEGDLVVTVEETKLKGMSDFRSMNVTHTFLMRNPEVMQMTASFLKTGRFAPPSTEGALK